MFNNKGAVILRPVSNQTAGIIIIVIVRSVDHIAVTSTTHYFTL